MAIDKSKVVTDITLELGEDEISLTDFSKAVDSFVGLIKEVSKSVSPKKNAAGWTVQVYPGSAGIGLSGANTFTATEVNAIRSAVLGGIDKLEHGIRSEWFSDKAIEHSRTLAGLFKKKSVQPSITILGGMNESKAITRNISIKAGEILDPAYSEDGAIDGVLEKLSAHGGFNFVVYDPVDDRAIQCEVNETLLDKAWKSWRKRVEVTGNVKYRRDGLAVSVRATDIFPFPDKENIPTLDQLRSIFAAS